MLPRNAASILAARQGGLKPAKPVVVSFVGSTPLDGPHVFADSGAVYDWTFLAGLRSIIVTRPGIDSLDAMRGLYRVCDPLREGYPVLIDCEREHLAYVVFDNPIRLWQASRDSELWASVFPWH